MPEATDRIQLRPFPGQPDNQPLAPRPAGYRTFDDIRAERARSKAASGDSTATPAEKATPHQAAARGAISTAKGTEIAKPDTRAIAERGTTPRDQGRTNIGQAGTDAQQVRGTTAPADKTSAAQSAKRESGNDKHPDPPVPPDKTSSARQDAQEGTRTPDVHHLPGNENPPRTPDAFSAQTKDKGGTLHGHAEFHGQKIDLYTDGTRWVGGDAVRAAQAEARRARAEGESAPQHHGITGIPRMSDLGRNTAGEKDERSPGDISHFPPAGQDLLEMENKDAPRVQRFANRLFRNYGDFADAAKDETDYAHDALTNPMPTGHAETAPPTAHPAAIPLPAHVDPGPGAIVEAALVTGLVMFRTGQAIEHTLRRDRRSEENGGH